MFHFLLRVIRVSLCVKGYTCFTLCGRLRFSLCVEGYVFHFVLRESETRITFNTK